MHIASGLRHFRRALVVIKRSNLTEVQLQFPALRPRTTQIVNAPVAAIRKLHLDVGQFVGNETMDKAVLHQQFCKPRSIRHPCIPIQDSDNRAATTA